MSQELLLCRRYSVDTGITWPVDKRRKAHHADRITIGSPLKWSYSDRSDGNCGYPCTPNGCPENHPTGIYVIDGPDTTSEKHAELLAKSPEFYDICRRFVFAKLRQDPKQLDLVAIDAEKLLKQVGWDCDAASEEEPEECGPKPFVKTT